MYKIILLKPSVFVNECKRFKKRNKKEKCFKCLFHCLPKNKKFDILNFIKHRIIKREKLGLNEDTKNKISKL